MDRATKPMRKVCYCEKLMNVKIASGRNRMQRHRKGGGKEGRMDESKSAMIKASRKRERKRERQMEQGDVGGALTQSWCEFSESLGGIVFIIFIAAGVGSSD